LEDTEAATMPRGAIQDINSRSFHFNLEPNEDRNTAKGRATSTKASSSTTLPAPTSVSSLNFKRAVRMINSIEVMSNPRFSFKFGNVAHVDAFLIGQCYAHHRNR